MPTQPEGKERFSNEVNPQIDWEAYLNWFEEKVYPTFHKHGIGKNTALFASIIVEFDGGVLAPPPDLEDEEEEWQKPLE